MTWEARPMLGMAYTKGHDAWMVGREHPRLGGFDIVAWSYQKNAFTNEYDARYIAAALNDYDPDGEMYDREHSRVPAGTP